MDALHDFLAGIVIPGPLLWFGACLGHGFFWMLTINWLYSLPIHHKILGLTRLGAFVLICASPVLFLDGGSFPETIHLFPMLGSSGTMHTPWVTASVFFCLMGFVVAPLNQLSYWLLRRQAPQVMQRDAEVVDFVRQLGYVPRGTGKRSAGSTLPGNQVFQVEFVDLHLRLPQMPPAWEGLTILHLTDLHFHDGADRRFYQAVFDRCRAWGTPDLLCVTGDIVDSNWHHRWIVPLLGKLRWHEAGLFILGNHDSWHKPPLIRRRFARLGMQDMGNQWKELKIRGQPMLAVGYEAPWFKPAPNLEGCPADIFRLCLSHSPDAIPWMQRHHVDLTLAGHVHGGQIRIPLLGSLFVPSRYSRRFDCGTFFEAPTVMHVSRGLGGKHMLRFNCRPEVTRLILHCG